ncbi:MAG: hypothetical protein WBE40_08225 [Thermoplasmata archaeon]
MPDAILCRGLGAAAGVVVVGAVLWWRLRNRGPAAARVDSGPMRDSYGGLMGPPPPPRA